MTMISRKPNRDHVAIFGRKLVDELPGIVGRAVVDKNQLEFLTAQGARGGRHLTMKFAQAFFFVAARHDDRKKHPSRAWHPVVNFHDFDSLQDNWNKRQLDQI
jgi:hypothetical protein